MSLSVTISRDSYYEDEIDKVRQMCDKMSANYYIAEEFGEGGGHPHIQMIVWTKKRSNNFRRALVTAMPEYEYDIINTKISKVDDELYVCGYCQKESPEKAYTNQPEEFLARSKRHYEERKANLAEARETTEWVCTGLNHLFPAVFKWCEEKNVTQYHDLQPVVQVMAGCGYLPVSLASKITTKKHQVMWDAFLTNHQRGDERRDFDHMIREALSKQERLEAPRIL